MRLILSFLRRPQLIAVVVVALLFGILLAANWQIALMVLGPRIGPIVESWETSNQTFRIHVDARQETNAFLPGAYYVFRSASAGSDDWHDIMTFRHDDLVAIPRDQIRFLNDHVGFVFMGWMYAVTTDGGVNWSVWDAGKHLPNWQCCNYGLINDVHLEADGTGQMSLDPILKRSGEVPALQTKDYGRHWNP